MILRVRYILHVSGIEAGRYSQLEFRGCFLNSSVEFGEIPIRRDVLSSIEIGKYIFVMFPFACVHSTFG
jgi:hypothetical protein